MVTARSALSSSRGHWRASARNGPTRSSSTLSTRPTRPSMGTISALDKDNIGFLKAGELDRVLCGMRDLVSNDRKSIIDVEDEDMLINYEQFAKMLLGADTY